MQLTTLQVLGLQFVVQSAALSLALLLVLRREQDWRPAHVVLAALGVTTGNVGIEWLFTDEGGWLTLIPALAMCLFVLFRFSWRYLRAGLITVSFFTVLYLLADRQLRAEFWQQQVDKGAEEDQGAPGEVVRYQQIADNMGFVPEKPVAEPATAPATNVAVEDAESVARGPSWERAREKLDIGGTLNLPDGRGMVMVDRQLRETGEVVSVIYERDVYKWLIQSITNSRVRLEQLAITPLEAPSSPAEPPAP